MLGRRAAREFSQNIAQVRMSERRQQCLRTAFWQRLQRASRLLCSFRNRAELAGRDLQKCESLASYRNLVAWNYLKNSPTTSPLSLGTR